MNIKKKIPRIFFLFGIITLVFYKCLPNKKKENKFSFYKTFHGNVSDNSPITMHLSRNKEKISGFYYYDFIGIPLALKGNITNKQLHLTEIGLYNKENGTINAVYDYENGTIEGIWTNTRIQKDFPVTLTEKTEGIITTKPETYFTQNITSIRDNQNEKDTSHIFIRTLKIESTNKTINTILNADIEKKIYNMEIYEGLVPNVYSIKDFLSSIHNMPQNKYLGIDIKCEVLMNTEPLLGLHIEHTIKINTLQEPITLAYTYNYNTETGHELGLDDILIPGYKDTLNIIAQDLFIRVYGLKNWYFQSGRNPFKVNDNFALTQGGILFIFNPFELSRYRRGITHLFIPYTEIKFLVRERFKPLFYHSENE